MKRENVPLFKLLWKSIWRARQDEFFRADCMYAMSRQATRRHDMRGDTNNAIITDSLSLSRQEVPNFDISGSKKHKKSV